MRVEAVVRIAVLIVVSFHFLPVVSLPAKAENRPVGVRAETSQSAPPQPLEPETPLERELRDGEVHAYSVRLSAGQFAHVLVEQKFCDVTVEQRHDGGPVMVIDSFFRSDGFEHVFWVAEADETIRVEVRPTGKLLIPGRYVVTLKALRPALPEDRARVEAQRLCAEADRIRKDQNVPAFKEAFGKLDAALTLWRRAGERDREAFTLNSMALLNYMSNNHKANPPLLNQALDIWRELGDVGGQAYTLNDLAFTHWALGEMPKCGELLGQALDLRRKAGDKRGEALTLSNLGNYHRFVGRLEKALEAFDQATLLFRELRDARTEAETLSGAGIVHTLLGDPNKALENHRKALALYVEAGDRGGEANTIRIMGIAYSDLAELSAAREHYLKALAIYREIGNRGGEATVLSDLGTNYDDRREWQSALDCYGRSLAIHRETGNRYGESVCLGNIGSVHGYLGDLETSLEHHLKALELNRAMGDNRGQCVTLNNLGGVCSMLGDGERALKYCSEAFALAKASGDLASRADSAGRLGNLYAHAGDSKKALDYLEASLADWRAAGNRSGESSALISLGRLRMKAGNLDAAREDLQTALSINRMVSDGMGQCWALFDLARIDVLQGRLVEAKARCEEGVALVERLRTRVDDGRLRASYFSTVRKYYELYTDVLMRLHQADPKSLPVSVALEVGERARARTLLELLAESRADIRQGVDPSLAERERTLLQRLDDKSRRLARLIVGNPTPDRIAEAEREVASVSNELNQVRTEIRRNSPRYSALTQPQPLSLKAIQEQILDAETRLLEYTLGEDRSWLWVVSKDDIEGYELPRRAEIEAAARAFRESLTGRAESRNVTKLDDPRRADEGRRTASELSRMILSPAAAKLTAKRLLIVADGVLNYMPFAALPVPSEIERKVGRSSLLVERFEIVSAPSASTLAVLRGEVAGRKRASRDMAVIADPVFSTDDSRIQSGPGASSAKRTDDIDRKLVLAQIKKASGDAEGGEEWIIPRLPGTRAEANRILSFVRSGNVVKAFDFTADRETVNRPDFADSRIIHFATHGFVNAEHPELSGLVLSLVNEHGEFRNGFLRAHEIYNLNLSADLAVLSACETGLGKEVNGEGLIGLTRGFMYAGVPRVVVSLWPVNDRATAELMTRFYRAMLKENLRPAQALRKAQIEMLKSGTWSSPLYWAAFQLQGEWR